MSELNRNVRAAVVHSDQSEQHIDVTQNRQDCWPVVTFTLLTSTSA